MTRPNPNHWAPYDYTPMHTPKPRKRNKSKVSQAQQGLHVSPSHDRASRDTEPNRNNDESVPQPPQRDTRSHLNGQQRGTGDARPFSSGLGQAQRPSRVPDIGEILKNFRPAEPALTFKEEPMDEDTLSLLPRRPSSARRRRARQSETATAAATKPSRVYTRRQSQRRTIKDHESSDEEAGGAVNDKQDPVFVDLTGDDEDVTHSHNPAIGPVAQQGHNMQANRFPAAIEGQDDENVPDIVLQQVSDQYREENMLLPSHVASWQQLESFARRNRNPSHITPTYLSQLRTFYASLGRPHEGPGRDSQFSFPISNLTQAPAHQPTVIDPIPHIDDALKTPPLNGFNPVNLIDNLHVNPNPLLEHQHSRRPPPHTPTALSPQGDAIRPSAYAGRLRPRKTNQLQVTTPSHQSQSGTLRDNNVPTASAPAIGSLMMPSNTLPDILPASAPLGHPRLVAIWNTDLLNLPTEQHDHLDLIDTAVSIMTKYDIRGQAVIRAFFNTKDFQHFFFLFKSRTSAWHSWSIERELDIVTIGLERNNRASNTAESSRPSSGQFDVTVQYKMDPAISPDTASPTAIDASTESNADPSQSIPPIPTHLQSSSNEPNQPSQSLHQSNPITPYPGKWHLTNTTIFPSSPPLPTFLWSTPPNRGADEVSRYHHPTQTALLPPSHLTMLARYLQHTSFTCTAIAAEFQVAWGRKVRYDSGLGRVRAVWDYALKGAKTQQEKRKRGEYNRPVGEEGRGDATASTSVTAKQKGKTKTGMSGEDASVLIRRSGGVGGGTAREDRPGAGDALGYLAGRNDAETTTDTGSRNGGVSTQEKITQTASGEGVGNPDTEAVTTTTIATATTNEVINEHNNQRQPTQPSKNLRTTTKERPRKRLKRETAGDDHSDSDSNSDDNSGSSDSGDEM